MKQTIFIKTNAEDELPNGLCKNYITDLGEIFFFPTNNPHFDKKKGKVVSWWLKEIQLDIPDDTEIEKEVVKHITARTNKMSQDEQIWSAGFGVKMAHWMRNLISNQLKNK